MNKLILLTLTILLSSAIIAQDSTQTESKVPFDGYDLSWVNGQNRQQHFPLEFK